MGAKHELREWLSIAPADIPVWVAAGLVIAMYYTHNVVIDVILSILIVGLTLYACILGMKQDNRISRLTNMAKKVFHPLAVLLGLTMIYVNFARWG